MSVRWLTELTPASSLPEFIPPPRFGKTHFSDYRPQHPSQELALEKTRAFVMQAPIRTTRWFWQKALKGKGLYLDGSFGVGKTHLLASAFDAFEKNKIYLSFAELVYVIGAWGKTKALETLGSYKLYCIDEFELDDPGNTLIVKTFLSHVFTQGSKVITTSNTPPAAQGQGRFNANDFKREIQSIAERFEIITMEGPDFRKRAYQAQFLTHGELEQRLVHEPLQRKVKTTWQSLFEVLQNHHPIYYADILRQMDILYIEQAQIIPNQNDALRFVHFIDKLYDLKVHLRISGDLEIDALFDPSYVQSAFAKKHQRCLSRIAELLEETV